VHTLIGVYRPEAYPMAKDVQRCLKICHNQDLPLKMQSPCTGPALSSQSTPSINHLSSLSSQQMAMPLLPWTRNFPSAVQHCRCRPGPRYLSSCMDACSAHVQYPCTHLLPPFTACNNFSSKRTGLVLVPPKVYSLPIGFKSRLGQRHGLQNTTLTSCFYKKYLWKSDICILLWKYFSRQIYSYNFYICKLNDLKVIDDLYSQCLTQTLSKWLLNPIPREYLGGV
jgi:hypothetical protein